jgi:hypothetical protein
LINFEQWWSREERKRRGRTHKREEGRKGRREEKTKLCYLHRFLSIK